MEHLNIDILNYTSGNLKKEALFFRALKQEAPTVVFLHGHNSNAWMSSLVGYYLVQNGFNALLISQPGYGLSEGELDFCGPATVKSVIDGINFYCNQYPQNSSLLGIWGISRGAIVASIVATHYPEMFAAQVFQSGAYDFKKFYTDTIPEIKKAIENEIKNLTDKEFTTRSLLYFIDRLQAPTLVIHGDRDERVPFTQAELIVEALTKYNKPHQVIKMENKTHSLGIQNVKDYIIPFFQKYLT